VPSGIDIGPETEPLVFLGVEHPLPSAMAKASVLNANAEDTLLARERGCSRMKELPQEVFYFFEKGMVHRIAVGADFLEPTEQVFLLRREAGGHLHDHTHQLISTSVRS
jgi:hypothetical protein